MKSLRVALPVCILFGFDALLSILIFVFTPAELRSTANFWISWVFAALIGPLAMLGLTVYTQSDRRTRLLSYRTVTGISLAFVAVYAVIFVIAAYLLRDGLTALTIVLEFIATVTFGIILFVKLFAVSLLRETDKKQAEGIAAKKSRVIPDLCTMIASAASLTEDAAIKRKLEALGEQLMDSNFPSPPSAAISENDLKALVFQINRYATLREYGEMDELIRKATAKLAERNMQCMMIPHA